MTDVSEILMSESGAVDQVLFDLLRYDAVLGAVAISREGLVVGSAGVSRQDADLVGALGASLIGNLDRTARRMGAGRAEQACIGTDGGMIVLRGSDDFAVLLFTERCDPAVASDLCAETVRAIGDLLDESGEL